MKDNNKIKWDTIRANSKVTLNEDTMFKGLCKDDEKTTIPKGTYYLSGFWADAVGIAITLKAAYQSNNKYLIYSKDLVAFEEVEDE